ncbi:cystathionine beta-lyase [Vararia minispora EC-137]|uniref:Cystathionine beta-lyase n=1 Tax=Vararia minispora EC-137 TaxID=1314806 RepID=A0ACB8Q8R7_9AGAM|nr:cystathionine beta-lyase [Vararia minispora EC-137]
MPSAPSGPGSSKGLLPGDDILTPDPDSPVNPRKPYRFATLCATVENPDHKDQYGSSSVPIYQTATFKGVSGEYDYTRSGNPTRSHLEHHIAKISSASHAFAVSSGMAALDVILRLLKPGDEVIAGDDLYGGTNRLLTYIKTHGGVVVHHVDTTEPKNVYDKVIAGKTAMVLLESPTNPLLKIADLVKIARDVKDKALEAIVVVDNTMMSPYMQRPLEYGADIVYDSATKYLSGHHDLMAGIITCNREDLGKRIAFLINSIGNALTPFDCFLLLRGVKTLAIRMDRQQSSAMAVATTLDRLGFTVYYPGLQNHPRREIHERNAEGYGAVLSFTTGDTALSERIVAATRLWGISVSFGCVNSLISMPTLMSHASIDPSVRAERGLPEDLIRLCVGIEDPADLLDDLEHALLEAGAITVSAGADEHVFVRASMQRGPVSISRAVEKLAYDENAISRRKEEWIVSAPGKVILFGEHAVVHGVTAIAASVDLRCYGLASPRDDNKLALRLDDLGGFYHEWTIDELPWESAMYLADSDPSETLDQSLVDAISQKAIPSGKDITTQAVGAAVTFLYIYMAAAVGKNRPSFTFSVRSSLPVGAGLGSSAAYSTCVSSAVLLLTQRVSLPTHAEPTRDPSDSDPGHLHVSHQGRRAIASVVAEEVNKWAFLAEKILHGNPSGVDNSVAVFGGALAYTRAGFARKSGMEPISGFKSFRFLLTDSRVPRDTKRLVAGVSAKKVAEPEVVGRLLDAIQSISDEARRALGDPEMSRDKLLAALSALIDENHAHLVALGVSHPSLETIREKTAAEPFKLSTKLTGAGGGGCAVTLLPDDINNDALRTLTSGLSDLSFVPYLTAVGGSGFGVLPPARAQSDNPLSYTDSFAKSSAAALGQWAEERGRWLYV